MVQQGDPLGPVLLALAIHPVIAEVRRVTQGFPSIRRPCSSMMACALDWLLLYAASSRRWSRVFTTLVLRLTWRRLRSSLLAPPRCPLGLLTSLASSYSLLPSDLRSLSSVGASPRPQPCLMPSAASLVLKGHSVSSDLVLVQNRATSSHFRR